MEQNYRQIPSVDTVLSSERISKLCQDFSQPMVKDLVREILEKIRTDISKGNLKPNKIAIYDRIEEESRLRWNDWPVRTINATGVILHTNMGRAPISPESSTTASNGSEGYSNLEIDLKTGARGSRQSHITGLLCDITGSDSAYVTNNNAAALFLGLAAIAHGKEVIISRSESIEIGGGFRIPDVLDHSGATLREIGTTNKTYGEDYRAAINENTGAILSVHASNFKIIGFTHSADISEISAIGTDTNIPVLHDLGSGCLLDTTKFGLSQEPRPQDSISSGSTLCFFSGDKLLGGPQAGIIVGKKKYVDAIARHPLARAFRIDKFSLAALHKTLLHYIRGEAESKIPIWKMISMPSEKIRDRALQLQQCLSLKGAVEPGKSTIGGGSLPGEEIETFLLSINTLQPDHFGKLLRRASTPVVSRIEENRLILDLRTVLPEEDTQLKQSLQEVIKAQ